MDFNPVAMPVPLDAHHASLGPAMIHAAEIAVRRRRGHVVARLGVPWFGLIGNGRNGPNAKDEAQHRTVVVAHGAGRGGGKGAGHKGKGGGGGNQAGAEKADHGRCPHRGGRCRGFDAQTVGPNVAATQYPPRVIR